MSETCSLKKKKKCWIQYHNCNETNISYHTGHDHMKLVCKALAKMQLNTETSIATTVMLSTTDKFNPHESHIKGHEYQGPSQHKYIHPHYHNDSP